MSRPHRLVGVILLAILMVPAAWGQASTVTLSGRVSDPRGAAVRGAQITATHVGTKTERKAHTDEDGVYEFTGLVPGRYKVSVELAAFRLASEEIEITAGAFARLNLVLKPSPLTDASLGSKGSRGGGGAAAPPMQNYATLKVFYATDRNALRCNTPDKCYGDKRSDELSYGSCEVSIPRDHRMANLESPSILKFEFRRDPKKHVVLLSVSQEPRDRFYQEVSAHVQGSQEHAAFVFIHGFNVTFEDAARRTAQLSYDLGFDGAPLFYSWPSKGSVLDYSADEATAEWATTHLKGFLEEVATRTGATTVHLVAHSMGNRPLTRALKDIATEQRTTPMPRFRQVVLAAPDIDAGVFRDLAEAMRRPADSVTLYASSRDKALWLSKKKHDYPRAGESGSGLVIVPGIFTVDVSDLETSLLGLNHSYFGDTTTVVFDLFRLFKWMKQPPDQRCGIIPRRQGNDTYWVFDPAQAANCQHN